MPSTEELAKQFLDVCRKFFEDNCSLRGFIKELDETLDKSDAGVDELLQALWQMTKDMK